MKPTGHVKLLSIAVTLLMLFVLTPVAVQAQGYPAFNIDSWTIDKESLQYGDEFVLTLTFTNVGTFGANEVLVEIGESSVFTGLGTSPRFYEMGIGAQVTASIRVGIEDDIEGGYYNLPVEFTYHHSALGGSRMSDVRTIGVYIAGEPDEVSVSPKLIIEGTEVIPGESGILLVNMTLHNIGTTTATDILINIDSSVIEDGNQVFSPAPGTSSVLAVEENIGVDEEIVATVELVVVSEPEGQVTQSFTLEYSDYNGGSYEDTLTVPILVGSSAAPYLIIQNYQVSPEPLSPGSQLRLTLDVNNLGSGPAKEVSIRLGEDIEALDPLAPIGSSNVLYVEEIPAQSQTEIGFDLIVDGDAESGLVPIDVILRYDSAYGIETEETFTISLQIESKPSFYISLFQDVPEPLTVGSLFELPIQIVNIGDNSINVNTVEVKSDILKITDGSIYMGRLDSGTSGSILAQAEAVQPGTATVVIEINYLDDFQQPQIYTHLLTFEIQDNGQGMPGLNGEAEGEAGVVGPGQENLPPGVMMDGMQGGPAGGGAGQMTVGQRIWQGILGFFGLATRPTGGFFVNMSEG